MRVFFALPLKEQLKLDIEQWQINNLPPSSHSVPTANFHITLAFTGTIRDSDLGLLFERTDEILKTGDFKTGSLKLIETGFWAKPEILWIGPKVWPENLTKLANKLQNVGRNFGAKKEKKAFRPHLTLSKKSSAPSCPTSPPDFNLQYDQIVLYQSIPIKSGVKYVDIQSWPLMPNN